MQASKTRSGSSNTPQKTSPITPRSTRQPRVAGPEPDSVTSTNPTTRTPTGKGPKLLDRRSPRSPASEKKCFSRMSELESQLIQAQEDLKKTKELLSSAETCKMRALEEADEAKKQYLAMASNYAETMHQLQDISTCEDTVVQDQNSVDSAALSTAMNEIQELKLQIEILVGSEAAQSKQAQLAHAELHNLKQDMVETVSLVEGLRTDLHGYEKSKLEYQELLSEIQMQLEVSNSTIKTLHFDGLEVIKSFQSVCVELDESKTQVNTLEGDASVVLSEVEQLRSALDAAEIRLKEEQVKSLLQICSSEDIVSTLQSQVKQLQSALEAAETRLPEQTRSTMETHSACELADDTRIESGPKEPETELALKEANVVISKLKADLIDKETEVRRVSDLNDRLKEEIEKSRSTVAEPELNSQLKMSLTEAAELKLNLVDKENELKAKIIDKETELHRILDLNEKLKQEIENLRMNPTESELESMLKVSMAEVAELKANLMDKETELQGISEENMVLKVEVQRKEENMRKSSESAAAELESARVSEQAAVIRLGHMIEEADKSSKRAAEVAEQLEAAQTTASEVEAELRRMRIQSEQWRKAAEAAAAILTTGNNGKLMERTGSMDSEYAHLGGKFLSSPCSEDMDDESPKKKKNNVLKKLGVLWKKGQK
uniref:Interactor of constitutive active ROPs 2, chloroplastic n=1 Tax=Anthurium amnicola TaxID=1678845 RepID=A0A1D1XT09_9ARAE